MWRLLAIMLTVAAGLALALPADAARKATREVKSKSQAAQVRKEDEDSAICIRARAEDPGGTYSAYPCWAQAAFGPRRVGGR